MREYFSWDRPYAERLSTPKSDTDQPELGTYLFLKKRGKKRHDFIS